MRRSALILAGLASFALGLILYLPATVATGWAESLLPGLSIGGVQGTALDGHAARVLYQDMPLEDVDWRLRPWTLLVGSAGADISLATDAGNFDASVSSSLFGGGLQVSSLSGTGSIEWLARRAGYTFVPVSGRVRARLSDLAVDAEGLAQAGSGRLDADGLRYELLNPPAALGRVAADLRAEEGTVTLEITDSDGPLALEGNARLQPGGIYRLDFRLRARADADPRLKSLLTELGEADAQGWYQISERGRL